MKKTFLLTGLFSIIIFTSCHKGRIKGEGAIVTETRTLPAITAVQADGDVDVEIFASNANSVEVSGYQNLLPVYESSVHNGKLTLRFRDKYFNVKNNNIKVKLYVNGLNSMEINGSGNMYLNTGIKSEDMNAEINGSGHMYIAPGNYQSMELYINGSGTIDSRAATAVNAHATISGSGDIDLSVSKYLDARISGSGTIDYWGNPEKVDTEISGSGKIRKN